MKPSRSPGRNTFQRDKYIERCEADGKTPSEDYLQMFESINDRDQEWEAEDHSNDMEWDLRTTDWMLEKVRTSEVYAQNLYAAMCNNDFQRIDVFPILANKSCSYSWRYAGGIIADMREEGDYIDWYCSGIRGKDTDDNGYVAESVVTEEIEADLKHLGWSVLPNDEDLV